MLLSGVAGLSLGTRLNQGDYATLRSNVDTLASESPHYHRSNLITVHTLSTRYHFSRITAAYKGEVPTDKKSL